MSDPAPLFTDTYDLTAWLHGGLHEHPSTLARALCQLSLELLDMVADGLAERTGITELIEADELLVRLRRRLRLAGSIELLDERRMLHALDRADVIGRQIGALLRHRTG